MSRGSGGGSDPLQQAVALNAASNNVDPMNNHGGGGSDHNQGEPPTGQESRSTVSLKFGSPGGPSLVATTGDGIPGSPAQAPGGSTPGASGATAIVNTESGENGGILPSGSGSTANVNTESSGEVGSSSIGAGSRGISGPGYPIIPGTGPALRGDATLPREPIPVLLPGPEPALALIPTSASAPESTSSGPASVPSLVSTTPASPVMLTSSATPMLPGTLAAPDTATVYDVGALATPVPAAVPADFVPSTVSGPAQLANETKLMSDVAAMFPVASSTETAGATVIVVPAVSPTLEVTIVSVMEIKATAVTGTVSTESAATESPDPLVSIYGTGTPGLSLHSTVSGTVMATTLLTLATGESASPSGRATAIGSGAPTTASSLTGGDNLVPTQLPSTAVVESPEFGALRGTTEAVASARPGSPDALKATSNPASGWVTSYPTGLSPNLHLGSPTSWMRSAPDRASTDAVSDPGGLIASDSPNGNVVSTTFWSDLAPTGDGSPKTGSPAKGDPTVNPADVARAWEGAGDWLADLVETEAGAAADRADQLALLFLAAGICVAWGNYSHCTRSIDREPDEERVFAGLAG